MTDSTKKKRVECFLSDADIALAHEKAGLPIVKGNKGNRNEAIRYCINKARPKAAKKI